MSGLIAICLLTTGEWCWGAAGTIQMVIGTARISQHTGQERSAARGDNLYEGDTVATDSNSNVQIRMIDEAIVWLRPDSQFKIDKYRSNQHGAARNEASLRLLSGTLRQLTGMIGKSSPSDYKLKTPNAVIGIRGTEFDAMYATPQIAAQLNTPAGTYNRVYEGSTFLESATGGSITLKKDQAGFMGLDSADKPKVLTGIPAFLNSNPSAAPERAEAGIAKIRSLQLSVRYGEGNSEIISSVSSRDNDSEQGVQVMEGERASLSLIQEAPSRKAGQAGGRPVNRSLLDLMVKLSGNSAIVQFYSENQSSSAAGSQTSRVATSLSVPLGVWTEVSGRGPWSGSRSSTISSNDARANSSKVYLKVDEIGR
ncbi:MAG: FecR domain-containing protein [Rhodoferax sp.]|nr:FecR domain-containing protein [Rhodoferax sp.]